jgi:hypothetical protein
MNDKFDPLSLTKKEYKSFDKQKIKSYPPNTIKTIPLNVNHSSFLGQKKNSPQHETWGLTAVAAVLETGPELCPQCKNKKSTMLQI